MKKIFLIFMIISTLGKLSAQQYIKISDLNIAQINESQIKANLKIDELFGTTVYNSHTTEVSGNAITLKVCYDIYMFDGGQTIENDFFLDIPSNPSNYTFKVEIYPWSSNGCFQTQNMEDSATIEFTTPFEGIIFLNTNDITNKDKNLKLYPNPVKDILHFSENVSVVKITDLSGKDVRQFNLSGKSIDVSKLPKGIYLISISTKDGKLVRKKLMKE